MSLAYKFIQIFRWVSDCWKILTTYAVYVHYSTVSASCFWRSRKMFKFSNWFVCVASFLVFFVVYEAQCFHSSIITLTEAEKQAVVDRHNYYRRKEGASNMQEMKWNELLADMVVKKVGDCSADCGHPPRENDKNLSFPSIGERMFSSSDKTDLITIIDRWYREKQHFNFDSNSCEKFSICGLYTQIVWSSTTDIGCSVVFCDLSSRYYHGCYYGPGQTYSDGLRPYEKGPACSKCNDTQLCDDGLCKY